ncbi:unnamed protein product [Caenorhabditis angaria]|uniref:Saposin B-type domain-containing protein n=1 Tax=Caenorhabditis angaria TaxID=860376 RepID=A0A9P1J3X0_9PELO|nr:unnamed protein product [Caenorhabditis angaria]
MKVFFVLFFLLELIISAESALRMADFQCSQCQVFVASVHGWFSGKRPSRRQIIKKLNGTCKRYAKYKRRCLSTVQNNLEFLIDEVTKNPFDASALCESLKDCAPLTDSVEFDYPSNF